MNRVAVGRKERERNDVHATFAPLILGRYVPPRFQFRAKVEMISLRLGEKGVYDAWRLKEETRRRRPVGARQNLNPFKQLPHFPGVYNSWEAAPVASSENCAVKNISTLVN